MANFGETLRRERELRDISLREIADATKVNLRYLEALEQNRFDILPGGVFNKGFIRAYARFIGADGETLVDRYLQEMAEREERARQASGAAPLTPGLHRPPEVPRRRSGPGAAAPAPASPAPPAAAPSTPRASPSSPIASGEAAARPVPAAVPVAAAPSKPAAHPPSPADPKQVVHTTPAAPAHHTRAPQAPAAQAPIFEAENGVAGSRSGGRVVATALWITGAVLIAFLGIWVIRGLRSGAPAAGEDRAPSTSSTGATGDEDAGTADAGTAPAAPSDTAGDGAAGDTGTGDAAGPTAPAGATATSPSPIAAPAVGEGRPETGAGGAGREPEPSRRDDSIEHPLRPGSAPQQATSPTQAGAPRQPGAPASVTIASAVPPPARGVESRPASPAAAGHGGMDFRIEATSPVWVQVACDGDERLNQALQPGQGYSMRCLSFVRLSVTDIAAVRLTVNGGRCVPPGDRGARIEGFVIRAEDADAICPTPQGAARGSR